MWDQMKQAKQLYKLQSELKKEKVEEEKDGVKVVLNGKMEVEEVKLNPELDLNRQEKAVKECFDGAMRKVQSIAAQKMQSMQQ